MRSLKFGAGAIVFWALAFAMPAYGQETVPFSGYEMGTIVIKTGERRLYYVVSINEAVRFPIGVGRDGMRWTGKAKVEQKRLDPPWQQVEGASPVIPGGSPKNPMGAAALVLRHGEYAIHGTNAPDSVGKFVSHGCIRMFNKDVLELFRKVGVGTPVVVLP